MIFLLFVVSIVVLEVVLRRDPINNVRTNSIGRPALAQESTSGSMEGLMALGRALDRHGKGETPAVVDVPGVVVPVANNRISGRKSPD